MQSGGHTGSPAPEISNIIPRLSLLSLLASLALPYRGGDQVVPGVGRQPGLLGVLAVGEQQPDHQGRGGQVADCQQEEDQGLLRQK